MDMAPGDIDLKLTVVRDYLRTTISQCHVTEGAATPEERQLVIIFGNRGRRTVRVSAALLASPRLDPIQFRESLQAQDIARRVLATPGFYLDAEAIRKP